MTATQERIKGPRTPSARAPHRRPVWLSSLHPATNGLPSRSQWMLRREDLLLRMCRGVDRARATGVSVKEALRRAVRKYRRQPLGNGRCLRLSYASAQRHWYVYKSATAKRPFRLRYLANHHRFPSYVLFLAAYLAARERIAPTTLFRILSAADQAMPFSLRTFLRNVRPTHIRRVSNCQRLLEMARTEQLSGVAKALAGMPAARTRKTKSRATIQAKRAGTASAAVGGTR